jgi:hypothetical protein
VCAHELLAREFFIICEPLIDHELSHRQTVLLGAFWNGRRQQRMAPVVESLRSFALPYFLAALVNQGGLKFGVIHNLTRNAGQTDVRIVFGMLKPQYSENSALVIAEMQTPSFSPVANISPPLNCQPDDGCIYDVMSPRFFSGRR